MARPMKEYSECPECHRFSAYFDSRRQANTCTNVSCKFHEPVEQPQMMSKWDIIDLIDKDPDVQDAVIGVFERKFSELWEEVQKERAEDEATIEEQDTRLPNGGGLGEVIE